VDGFACREPGETAGITCRRLEKDDYMGMSGNKPNHLLPELKITQAAFADRLGITRHRLSEIHHGKRSVTPDTAMRLARVLGTEPEVWLGMQHALDLWDALHSPEAKKIAKLRPLKRSVA